MRRILVVALALLALAGVAAEPRRAPTSWRVEYAASFPDIAPGDFIAPLTWHTTGSIRTWDLTFADVADGGLFLQYVTAAGAFGGPYRSNVAVDDGRSHRIRVTAKQAGPDVVVNVDIDGRNRISQVIAGVTLGRITRGITPPTARGVGVD